MPQLRSDNESWRRMVLSSMPPPDWLRDDAPNRDVALSTRVRVMRNLVGFPFPHRADPDQLREVARRVHKAFADAGPQLSCGPLESIPSLTAAEREYLIGCRLISHEFRWREAGRVVLLDKIRRISVMVNEEDHLRMQALTPGWSPSTATDSVSDLLETIDPRLDFAWSPSFGYLAASPFNAGAGMRVSGMFHLIGLAANRKLPTVLRALSAQGLAARGLFGESTRAVGAFVQVSVSRGGVAEFAGAVDYLLGEERNARRGIDPSTVAQKARQAAAFAVQSRSLNLSDALRVMGYARWAATLGLKGFPPSPREVDRWLTQIELRASQTGSRPGEDRASFLRTRLEPAVS